jgi:hypothetical protein
MRKLLVLLFIAAIIGMVISKTRRQEEAGDEGVRGTAAIQEKLATPQPAESRAAARKEQPSVKPAASEVEPKEAREDPRPEADEEPSEPRELVVLTAKAAPAALAAPAEVAQLQESARAGDAGEALDAAVELLGAGKNVEARAILSDLYLKSRGEMAVKLRDLLDYINEDLVFNPRNVEGALIHVVQPRETLSSIGAKYGLSWRMIARVNGMQDDRIRVGQQIKVLPGPASLVAYKGEFRIALLLDGVYVKEYPIGIGLGDRTPSGEFVVDDMLVRPRWYRPGGGIVEYGEEGNLLGERWIGFADEPGAAGLGIHGTVEEDSIGTKCSNGCLRLRNEDVIEVYDFMRPGSHVVIKE